MSRDRRRVNRNWSRKGKSTWTTGDVEESLRTHMDSLAAFEFDRFSLLKLKLEMANESQSQISVYIVSNGSHARFKLMSWCSCSR